VRLPPAALENDSSNIQPQTAPSHHGAQPAHNEEMFRCVHCKDFHDTFDAVSLHETKCAANREAEIDQLSNVTPTSGQQALSTNTTYLIQSMTKEGMRIGTQGRASGVQCSFSAGTTTDGPVTHQPGRYSMLPLLQVLLLLAGPECQVPTDRNSVNSESIVVLALTGHRN